MKISHLFLYLFHSVSSIMIHHIRPFYGFDSNVYLLTGDRNILIDTGTGLSSDYYIRSIRDVIGEAGVLDSIILTHCHFDHIGGAPALINAFRCNVYAGAVDAVPIREGDSSYTLSSDFGVKIPPIPVEDLHQDDVIDIGSHRLHEIDTPGHTMGGICLYDDITSSLFSGDTLFSDSIGRTDFKGGSISSLRNSIKYLSDIAFKDLYPGHGNPTKDGSTSIKIALQMVGN